jgi:negative regulator of replication initiation
MTTKTKNEPIINGKSAKTKKMPIPNGRSTFQLKREFVEKLEEYVSKDKISSKVNAIERLLIVGINLYNTDPAKFTELLKSSV